ncbi:hypothetical protein QCA50_008076 [Cerrena zonata]|uniref:Glucose-methanol-choline oxidoreductase N-terminal domain-containing protein n=1 Tax=Cerrena zonata TaxID=2478898 RepID=A0AAW0G4E1_9APHY
MSNSEYDLIFAGGGTAACVIVGRLLTVKPDLRILVVEAGPHTQDDLAHTQPARFINHLQPDSQTVRFYQAKESEILGGRAIVVPTGRCVGGGSSVNFVMYTRASASDYDDWATKYQNPGWSSEDLVALLQKSETFQALPNLPTHGYSGPIKVSYGGATTNVGNDFLDVAAAYDKQRKFTDDPNGLYSCDAYGRWPKYLFNVISRSEVELMVYFYRWVDKETGKRSDTAHHFLYPHASNPNLDIVIGCLVKRVIFQGDKAVGIEYLQDPAVHQGASKDSIIATARQSVILSAGSFGTPAILERSGIGSSALHNQLGIQTVVDLPGVGENYQDHCGVFSNYHASDESDTLDGIARGNENEIQKWSAQWLADGSGLMAHNGIDAGIKLRPTKEEVEKIGPAFSKKWEAFYANAPDKPVIWLGTMAQFVGDFSTAPNQKFFTVPFYAEHPSARGHVHITSAEDVLASPDFQPKYLMPPEDKELFIWGYKKAREYARRMKCYRGEYKPYHPSFTERSDAAFKEDPMPVPTDTPNIIYSKEDDEAIWKHLQSYLNTTWHSIGTCAMKPRAEGGVVDSRLNVYGVRNLKVADLSICPGNVAANTYSTALLVGEKAACIIAQELGIQGV